MKKNNLLKIKKLLYIFALLTLVSCSTAPEIDYPFSKIDSKIETEGIYNNTMELYTTPELMSLDTLRMFCKDRKGNMSSGAFYYIVFFDSKDNAEFPNNPMTAFYGMEEEPQKHIRAYFEYNHLNGYCKLHVYETNSWESKSTTFDL